MLRPGHGVPRSSEGDHRPTVVHRCRFYRYAVEEDLLEHSPAAHVRRPRLDYESHAVGLDRNEVGALLVAAGLGTAAEHALISLLAINGLRISEALGADIDKLGLERGHRTLTVLRKGGKIVTIPLAPRTARAIDLAIGERLDGPIFLRADGSRMDRHCAERNVRRVAPPRRVSQERSARTSCGTRSLPPPSTLACRCVTSRKRRRTPTRAPPCVATADESPSTGTSPTSSPRTSPALPAETDTAGRPTERADFFRCRPTDGPPHRRSRACAEMVSRVQMCPYSAVFGPSDRVNTCGR
jgi:hypothetical protein